MARKSSSARTDALNVEAAASYLEAIASGLRLGLVVIGSGGEQVDLRIPDAVTIDLEGKAHAGKKKSSFKVAMSWRMPKRPRPEGTRASGHFHPASTDGASSEEYAPLASENS